MFQNRRDFCLIPRTLRKNSHWKIQSGICFLNTLLFPIMMDSLKQLCFIINFSRKVFKNVEYLGQMNNHACEGRFCLCVRRDTHSVSSHLLCNIHLAICQYPPHLSPHIWVWVVIFFDYNIGKHMLYWIGDCHLLVILLLFLLVDSSFCLG